MQRGHGATTPRGLPVSLALEQCTSCGLPGLSITAHRRDLPQLGLPRGIPGERFRPSPGVSVQPRAVHLYPGSTDPDPPPGLGAPPRCRRRERALGSGQPPPPGSSAARLSPAALTAQGAKQEAGTNGRTGGPG